MVLGADTWICSHRHPHRFAGPYHHGTDAGGSGDMNEAEDSGDFGLSGGDVCSIPPVIGGGLMIDVPAYLGLSHSSAAELPDNCG